MNIAFIFLRGALNPCKMQNKARNYENKMKSLKVAKSDENGEKYL